MSAVNSIINEIEDKIIRKKDGRYLVGGYLFIMRALDFLMEKIVAQSKNKRHVSGKELSGAVRELALEEYGPTAKLVLSHWGINETGDIGNIVYNLIEVGLMGKNESDRLEDFSRVYDFEDEFVKKFRFDVQGLNKN
jgi:uncharacterized repeat protein (TIGR04138 family)